MICNIHKFRAKLSTGQVCLGPGISLSDPAVTEALCDSVDFLWLDLEHSPISLESLQAHVIAARAGGAPMLVRVPSGEVAWVKRVLDIGAEGVILPQVGSLAEVEQFVAACRYPPQGRRGFGPRRATNYGRQILAAYLAAANREVFVAIQIETAEALEAVDAIVRVPGIDSLVIGPADLAGALAGAPGHVEHPQVMDAIATVCARARAVGLSVGIGMGPDAEYATRVAKLGVQWIQCGGDCGFMIRAADTLYQGIRRRLEEGTPNKAGR
jgi:2-dehydro-3-deoxyglucarate aldolase/4-hydroxy-2-oxoheptanedioate aldolase